MNSRPDALLAIADHSFDVCVIGGGATGAGCALDAQLRGLQTVLVDAADFASGASSASTKMVHGGVRYLEQAARHLDLAEYEVVKRALRERIRMLRNAPFLTRTREFITPCYSWRDVAYYTIGLKLYDWIAGDAGLAPSRFLSREDALRRIPALNPAGLIGAVAYTDGQFDDARYNIALIESFAQLGGQPLNYARVIGFERATNGKIAVAEIEDQLSPRRFSVHAHVFVNATGPFSDSLRELAAPGVAHRMRPSRGVHILLPLESLARVGAKGGNFSPAADLRSPEASTAEANIGGLLIPKTEDGRVLFAIPWMGRLLVGTTDEPVEQPAAAPISPNEIEYLLRHLNRYLAQPVTPNQIVSAFSGVRPLVSSGKSLAASTKQLARDHIVEVDGASGLISIMGGKWTTYRAMAEDTIDAVERRLNRAHVSCRTADHSLAGAEGRAHDSCHHLVAGFGISEPSARHLIQKFGSRATGVLALTKENSTLAEPLVASPPSVASVQRAVTGCHSEPGLAGRRISLPNTTALAALRAEVVFCVRYEMAVSIEDILARRLGLESFGWREALAAAPAVADLLATELRWSDEEKRRSLAAYVSRINTLLHSTCASE